MTIETLQTLSMICFLLSAVFFLFSVALFFILNIVKVVGDLSGLTARKAIEDIQNQTEVSDTKKKTTRNTSGLSLSAKLKKTSEEGFAHTAKLATGKLAREAEATTVLPSQGSEETTLLQAETTVLQPAYGQETTVLQPNYSQETTVLQPAYGQETTVLAGQPAETTVLDGYAASPTQQSYSDVFCIDYEIWLAASAEIIS